MLAANEDIGGDFIKNLSEIWPAVGDVTNQQQGFFSNETMWIWKSPNISGRKLADGPQFHWWFPWWFYWKANLAGETPKDTPKLQWPFQDPKMKVPTMYKAYFSGLNFRG